MKENLILRGIKIIDISYITCIYTVPTLYVASLLDKYIYTHINLDSRIPDEEKSIRYLLTEVILCLCINGIVSYILRNILQLIPFPLNGVYGFKHIKVREVASGSIINMVLMWFSSTIRNKLLILQKKFKK